MPIHMHGPRRFGVWRRTPPASIFWGTRHASAVVAFARRGDFVACSCSCLSALGRAFGVLGTSAGLLDLLTGYGGEENWEGTPG
jgi:hypothetical protein